MKTGNRKDNGGHSQATTRVSEKKGRMEGVMIKITAVSCYHLLL
jgi:hypothetical protein